MGLGMYYVERRERREEEETFIVGGKYETKMKKVEKTPLVGSS